MKLRAICIDDEERAIDVVKYLVHQYTPNEVEIIGTVTQADQAKRLINELCPDLVFLDIDMPKINGIELIKLLPHRKFYIIYITAHRDFALDALKLGATDYLLKPIDPVEFCQAISKVNSVFKSAPLSETLSLHTHKDIEVIAIQDIVYLKANGVYTEFYISNGKSIIASKNLKYYEDLLIKHKSFLRIHHSYLVHMKYVAAYGQKDGYHVRLIGNQILPVATRRWDMLKKWFDI